MLTLPNIGVKVGDVNIYEVIMLTLPTLEAKFLIKWGFE